MELRYTASMNDLPALKNTDLVLDVEVAADYFSLGRCWEDGSDLVHSAYSVRVTDAKTGRRWIHNKTFHVAHDCHGPSACIETEGCQVKQEFRWDHEAELAAELLAVRVRHAYKHRLWEGPVGNVNWTEGDPAYGSEAYEAAGVEAREAAQERRDEGFSF
jgi:hypothetical protein